MPLSHYVTLGRSGLRVSPFCLGTMTFGEDLGWGSSVADSTRILDRYIERGGNFIDTANACTRGHSEKIIGDHLGRDSRKRERVVLATKFFSTLYTGAMAQELGLGVTPWSPLGGAGAPRRRLDHHRRAHAGPARRQPRRPRPHPAPAGPRQARRSEPPQARLPGHFLGFVGGIAYGGTNIQGVEYASFPNAPKSDAERY
jgi:aryl-alcohol dehydrogenase-like predicted oxidoreductase